MTKPVLKLVSGAATHQQEVDALFATAKAQSRAGKPSIFKPAPPAPAASTSQLDHRMAEELQLVERRLKQLGEMLANDPVLVTRYAGPLQSVDLMGQILAQLAEVITKEDKTAAVERISLRDLKARLQRKPLRPIGFN